MSGASSIVFTRFTADSAKLAAWSQHAAHVVGSNPDGAAVPASSGAVATVVWHLRSANNRMLGKSAMVFESFGDASRVAAQFIAGRDQVKQRFVSEGPRLAYGWFASLDDVPLITCARWYSTERDRRSSAQLALESLRDISIGLEARLVPAAFERSR